MGYTYDGIDSQLDFTTVASIRQKIGLLLSAIPDPDTTSTSGSQQGIISYLDEMSPIAATVLGVELRALQDNIDGGATHEVAFGSHIVTAGEATANQADIVTGLADITIAKSAVQVWRAGANVTVDAVITEPVAGTIRVADGAVTYNMTAGDVINWFAREA